MMFTVKKGNHTTDLEIEDTSQGSAHWTDGPQRQTREATQQITVHLALGCFCPLCKGRATSGQA